MKTPWHVWAVGILSLVWNAGGAFDYVMARTKNAGYLDMVPAEFRSDFVAYLDAMPVWASFGWGLGVWASIVGSLLILLRSRHAVAAFWASLAGLAINSVYTYGVAEANLSMMAGNSAKLMTAAIVVILIALAYYCTRQRAAGRLT